MPQVKLLQWSRPQLRTETRTLLSSPRSEVIASMEPSSVEDGNFSGMFGQAESKPASMEPSSVEDGNAVSQCASCRSPSSFNGAVLS